LTRNASNTLMKYGMRVIASPDFSYEELLIEIDDMFLTSEDFKDFEGFVSKLARPSNLLSEHLKRELTKTLGAGGNIQRVSREDFISELNRVISEPIFIKIDTLPADAQQLITDYNLSGRYRHQNRILLEEVYPDNFVNSRRKPESRWSDKFIFYTYLHEYSIYDGVYPHVNSEDSPFSTLTINITARVEDSVKQYRRLITKKRKDFYKKKGGAVTRLRWILPNNLRLESLENALKVYKLHIRKETNDDISRVLFKDITGKDYEEVVNEYPAEKLAYATVSASCKEKIIRANQYIETQKNRCEYQVKNYLKQAEKIMKNVERGIFP